MLVREKFSVRFTRWGTTSLTGSVTGTDIVPPPALWQGEGEAGGLGLAQRAQGCSPSTARKGFQVRTVGSVPHGTSAALKASQSQFHHRALSACSQRVRPQGEFPPSPGNACVPHTVSCFCFTHNELPPPALYPRQPQVRVAAVPVPHRTPRDPPPHATPPSPTWRPPAAATTKMAGGRVGGTTPPASQ